MIRRSERFTLHESNGTRLKLKVTRLHVLGFKVYEGYVELGREVFATPHPNFATPPRGPNMPGLGDAWPVNPSGDVETRGGGM